MTQKSSRTLPFFVLAIVSLVILFEGYSGVRIDLEAYMPVLVAIGVGGAAKSAIERAAKAQKEFPKEDMELIKKALESLKTKGSST